MNPDAKPFVFSASAAAWTPGGFTPPAPPVQEATPPPTAPAVEEPLKTDPEEGEEEIDENDPLWKATLQIAKGDRKVALKLLEDPDALMQYPEVAKMMEEAESTEASGPSESAVDDWDQQTEDTSNESKDTATAKKSADSVRTDADAPTNDAEQSSTAGKGAVEEEAEEVDSDPRSHMNIVFIGHVDAGKSTLSGSILYLMGKVDTRTIERFEREAKQRNRESWFLAFIM
ncbi:SUP35, partial [Symbiodinium microadriaticum]